MIRLGQLLRLDPRSVWSREATDFTPWLADNLDQLGVVLGMDLELVGREATVGDFAADLVARDLNRDRVVIIENQLNPTDHTHLGQLITYAAGLDAGAVVWVSPQLREEHRQALDWLNRQTESDFFGVALELVQVDGSLPAINFRLAAFPNNWSRRIKHTSENRSDRAASYQEFFQALIDELREKHDFTSQRVAQPQNWVHFSAGVAGIRYGVTFSTNGLRAELYIDVNDADLNTAIFDVLARERVAIEQAFGSALAWEPLEAKRACRISSYRGASSLSKTDGDELRAWAIDRLLRLRAVLSSRLRPAVAEAQRATHDEKVSLDDATVAA